MNISASENLLRDLRARVEAGEEVAQIAAGMDGIEGVTDAESFLKGVEYALVWQRAQMAEAARAGQRKAREAGTHIGRPAGSGTARERSKLFPHEARIREMLSRKVPVCRIAAALGVDRHTLATYIRKYLRQP